MPATQPISPHDVLDFWFADGLALDWPSRNLSPLWFGGGAQQDALIRHRFGPSVEAALAGGLTAWEAAPLDRLALIVLIDQFSRNTFRGQARAFSGDARAQALVTTMIARQQDAALPRVGRVFVYMPLMHAEHLALQDQCVASFTQLQAQAPQALQTELAANLKAAHEHRDIVARFGRFPHRNAVLGRSDTPEETEFLKNGPRFGQ